MLVTVCVANLILRPKSHFLLLLSFSLNSDFMPLLTISNLVKHLGTDDTRFTLRVPHFSVEQGVELALTGTSGSGKTTLLNLLCGIVSADEGSITLLDTDITRLPESKRDRFRADHIGIVYQTFNLLQGFTAQENVMLGATFGAGSGIGSGAASGNNTGKGAGKPSTRRANDVAARAEELLVRLGLRDRMNRKPPELSVGQQQRVAVARALINAPALVLADEPTANVDAANGVTIIEELRLLARETNAALLIVSHDAGVVQQFPSVIPIHDIITA
jgi:putative ABC transport system ATP-binding protein